MPTWRGLHTWSPGEIPTAADFNSYLNDNLDYLLNPNKVDIVQNTGTYTATSTTLVNIDPSLVTSITTNGGPLLVGFSGLVYATTTAEVIIAVALDGVQTVLATATNGVNDARAYMHGLVMLTPAAGAHSIALQWRCTTSVALNFNKAGVMPLRFWAVEI